MDLTISQQLQNLRTVAPVTARSGGTGGPPATPPSTDSVAFSDDGLRFQRFLDKARAEPDVREDVVASFRERIANGSYPPPSITDGLTRLIGAAFAAGQA